MEKDERGRGKKIYNLFLESDFESKGGFKMHLLKISIKY